MRGAERSDGRRWTLLSALLVALGAALLGGCGGGRAGEASQPHEPRVVEVQPPAGLAAFPRLDSSTSAQPLAMITLCTRLGIPWHWAMTYADPANIYMGVAPTTEKVSDRETRYHTTVLREAVARRLRTSGTHGAYLSLIGGESDLCFIARRPSEEERRLAETEGVGLELRAVALDAFVFLVNRYNPTRNLRLRQLRGIYSGEIASWRTLGWRDLAIHPYQRNATSGSQELLRSLVMKDRPLVAVEDAYVTLTMMGPIDRLGGAANAIHSARSPFGRLHRQAGDLQGIAFTVFFYEERMAPTSNVRRIAVDGVMPWAETIRTRRYPLTSEVQLVIRADAPQRVRALRDWLLSAEGQERVVRESGYVPIIDAEAAAPADE